MAWTRTQTSTLAASGSFIRGAAGANLASAGTITLTDFVHVVTGSTTINTINAPSGVDDALFCLIPASAASWSLGTSGNISEPVRSVVGRPVYLHWDGTTFRPISPPASAYQDHINVKEFAVTAAQRLVVGDGNSKPLSGYYATLALAQADYPHAANLNQQLDWAVIQGAINATPAAGGEVFLPVGTYITGSASAPDRGDPLVAKTNLVLRGEVMNQTSIKPVDPGIDAIDCDGVQNARFEEFAVIGPDTGAGNGIHLDDSDTNYFRRVRVQGFDKNVVLEKTAGTGSFLNTFELCWFNGTANTNYHVYATEDSNSNLFLHCIGGGMSAGTALYFDRSNGLNILGGAYEGNQTTLEVDNSTGAIQNAVALTGVHFEFGTSKDIILGTTNEVRGVSIDGCLFDGGSATYCIDALKIDGLSVTGCTKAGTYSSGDINLHATNSKQVSVQSSYGFTPRTYIQSNSAAYQDFVLWINNNGGTFQHKIAIDSGGSTLPTYSNKITGASTTYQSPTEADLVTNGFDGDSFGLIAGQTHWGVFNTAGQVSADTTGSAEVVSNDTGNAAPHLEVRYHTGSFSGGASTTRFAILARDPTAGTPWALDSGTNIPAGKTLMIRVRAYIS